MYFPKNVKVTKCVTHTHTHIVFTNHGIVRTEVLYPKSRSKKAHEDCRDGWVDRVLQTLP